MIPLATTTVRIERPTAGVDPYDPDVSWTTVATVAAHISGPSGRERSIGGQQTEIDAVLLADIVDLRHQDRVVDLGIPAGDDLYIPSYTDDYGATDVARYEVTWVRQRQGLGLAHTKAGLKVLQGASNG